MLAFAVFLYRWVLYKLQHLFSIWCCCLPRTQKLLVVHREVSVHKTLGSLFWILDFFLAYNNFRAFFLGPWMCSSDHIKQLCHVSCCLKFKIIIRYCPTGLGGNEMLDRYECCQRLFKHWPLPNLGVFCDLSLGICWTWLAHRTGHFGRSNPNSTVIIGNIFHKHFLIRLSYIVGET